MQRTIRNYEKNFRILLSNSTDCCKNTMRSTGYQRVVSYIRINAEFADLITLAYYDFSKLFFSCV